MPSLGPLSSPWSALSSRARAWSAGSQQQARRNAMVASTALAARRRDREEVEEFFDTLEEGRSGTALEAGGDAGEAPGPELAPRRATSHASRL